MIEADDKRFNADLLRMLRASGKTTKRTLEQHRYFLKVFDLFHKTVELAATEDATREQVKEAAKNALKAAADYITDTSAGN